MSIELFASPDRGSFISDHRGYSAVALEDTLIALEAALAAGAHVAEIDVKLTKDRRLVLMHDATLDPAIDGRGPISALTLAEITLDAGRWFERKFAGTTVPAVDEMLAWSRGRLGILVELKNCPVRDPKFIGEVIGAIERQSATDFAIPPGFDHRPWRRSTTAGPRAPCRRPSRIPQAQILFYPSSPNSGGS